MVGAITGAILGVTHTAPEVTLPPGSCDCHTHVFGAPGPYPYDPARTYTPDVADIADIRAHQAALGLDRVVIVQPSPYGTDNSCTLDAVAALGDCARAVAVIDPGLAIGELRALHERGVRGVRLNLETVGQSDPEVAFGMLRRAAEQVAPLGWHVQIYTNLRVIAALQEQIMTLPVPLVIDHFGRAMASGGAAQAGFSALLELLRCGAAYVKVSAAHRIATIPDDAAPIAAALIAANPARVVWGSDWPHPAGRPGTRDPAAVEPFSPIDDGLALDRLHRWAAHEATWKAILVDNPARLYGFDP